MRKPHKGAVSRSTRPRSTPAGGARRKNPRLLAGILAQSPSAIERFFEIAGPDEVLQIFEESYAWSLVNVLLDLKKSTTRRLFDLLARQKKRSFINVFTLYYYKEYLTNPLPLTLESETGKHVSNHYAILGVPRDATPEELKESQKLLAAAFGADSFPPSERRSGEDRLREVDAAFDLLKNPKQRKLLDEALPSISYLYPRRDQWWLVAVSRLVS